MALRTSPVLITPSFSPFFFSENKENASRISFSSAPVILCSLANLDCRTFGVPGSGPGARRLGGYEVVRHKVFQRDIKAAYHCIAQSLCERILLEMLALGN